MDVEERVVMIRLLVLWLRSDTQIGSDTNGWRTRRHFYLRWLHRGNRGAPEFHGASYGYERILCMRRIPKRLWAASDMTEGPRDGAATEEDRRRRQPPRLRL